MSRSCPEQPPAAPAPAIKVPAPDAAVLNGAVPSVPVPPAAPLTRFDIAASRANARYTAEAWALLDPGKRTAAIYAELRRLDGGIKS